MDSEMHFDKTNNTEFDFKVIPNPSPIPASEDLVNGNLALSTNGAFTVQPFSGMFQYET